MDGVLAAYGLGFAARDIAAGIITPRAAPGGRLPDLHRRRACAPDGFVSMKYDYRPNAWELVNKHGVKRHGGGGGDGAEVLKQLIYIGLFVAAVALKVCARH